MTAILLVDDQEIVRQGLVLLLSTVPDVQVLGQADSGSAALAWLGECPAAQWPDVVVTDAKMPGMSGPEFVAACADQYPDLPCIILTTFDSDDVVLAGVDAGAAGFLLKDVSVEDLAAAIHKVNAGELVLDPRVATSVVQARRRTARTDSLLADLTATEQKVARLVAEGLSNAQISAELHLAAGTVKNYVSSILAKTQHTDRTALAVTLRKTLNE